MLEEGDRRNVMKSVFMKINHPKHAAYLHISMQVLERLQFFMKLQIYNQLVDGSMCDLSIGLHAAVDEGLRR